MNIKVWKSWFIVELYKEVPPLLSLVLKMLATCFFGPSSNFQCQGAKRQKSFILYQYKHSFKLLSSQTKMGVLLSHQHPLCRRA